jgi:hypothetical protein
MCVDSVVFCWCRICYSPSLWLWLALSLLRTSWVLCFVSSSWWLPSVVRGDCEDFAKISAHPKPQLATSYRLVLLLLFSFVSGRVRSRSLYL